MRTTIPAAFALVVATIATPAAADPNHRYEGGCGLLAFADPTSWSALGTPGGWHGVAYVHARGTDGGDPPAPTGDPLAISCDIYVNGIPERMGAVSSTGGAFAASRVTYAAEDDDVVTLCEDVEVGASATYHCEDVARTPVVPEPVWELVEILRDDIFHGPGPDRTICPMVAAAAGQYGPVLIDSEGDVYVLGNGDAQRWYDCPPYGLAPNELVAQPTIAARRPAPAAAEPPT